MAGSDENASGNESENGESHTSNSDNLEDSQDNNGEIVPANDQEVNVIFISLNF